MRVIIEHIIGGLFLLSFIVLYFFAWLLDAIATLFKRNNGIELRTRSDIETRIINMKPGDSLVLGTIYRERRGVEDAKRKS